MENIDEKRFKGHALLPTKVDARDFKLGAITDLPALSELPDGFLLSGIEIKTQVQTDFCTQFASCGTSGLQEGVSLSPEWAFAKSKEISKNAEEFGQDIRIALSVHTKYGVPEASEVPYTVNNKDSEFLRHIENYPPDLLSKATKHIKKSYADVTGTYDYFDDIRASIWKYRSEKRGIISGLQYGWSIYDKELLADQGGGGHCIYYAGWRKKGSDFQLALVQSYGKEAGENGIQWVSRSVVNKYVSIYGAFMFIDMDPDTVKYMIEHGITDRDNWLTQLLKILGIMKVILSLQKQLDIKKKP